MYKQNNKNYALSGIIKSIAHWLKRKIILIIAAFMVGISNGMYQDEKMVNDNQNNIEQEQKEKNDNTF